MKNVDLLEHGGGHFCIRHGGQIIHLPDPTTRNYQWVLGALQLEFVPGTPGDIPDWKRALVFDRWRAAWDLPDFANAHRLTYLVDHYRAAISHDLTIHAGLDLGELWRARRWTKLLDIIDRLPAHSWYAAAVATDEDHAKMLAESLASRRDSGEEPEKKGPPLVTWTPEVAALHGVWDAVRRVEHAVFAAEHGKKAGDPPKPLPRPVTALEKAMAAAERQRRQAAHEALVARVLPRKKEAKPPSED